MQIGFIEEMQCPGPKLVNGSEDRCSFLFDKKYDELRWFRVTRVTAYGMNVFRGFVKYLPGTKELKRASANLHLNFPFENIDNRVRIMPVDRVDGSWGVIDSNDFNLFTRCFRKLFREERIHLQGMRCRDKSQGKDEYRQDELLHVVHLFCPFGDVLRQPACHKIFHKVSVRNFAGGSIGIVQMTCTPSHLLRVQSTRVTKPRARC